MSQLFWLVTTIACLVWYSTITLYVAVRGASDIVTMLKKLSFLEESDKSVSSHRYTAQDSVDQP
jgi:ABC-type microcin C transport system permease subunit YejB